MGRAEGRKGEAGGEEGELGNGLVGGAFEGGEKKVESLKSFRM